jgi:Domain of unknown function (DUF4203)
MGLIDFLEQLFQTAGQYNPYLAIGLLAVGIFSSFWGFYWLKITLVIQGFISGFIIICIISFYVNILAPNDVFVLAFWGGLITSVIMLVSNRLAKFLMGAYTGGLLALTVELSIFSALNPYVIFISFALVGILFLFVDDFVLTVVVSFAGAWGLVSGIALLLGTGWFNPLQVINNPASNMIQNIVLILGWILVAVAGMFIQFGLIKKKQKNIQLAVNKEEAQVSPAQEESPSMVAVKRDIGWDALVEKNTKPRRTAPFTTQPPIKENISNAQPTPQPAAVPEQEKPKPRKRWINPFFTDPFTTKEGLGEEKVEQQPKTAPFKRD